MKVSVILPTYNESGNIIDLILAIKKNIPEGWESEIIIADDNSPDGTFQLVKQKFAGDSTVIPILRTEDRGLGKAIRAGIDRSSGDQILVMDTDFTHDPIEIPKLLHVGMVYDLVSGSRFCPGGNMQDVKHYFASLAYNVIMRLILRTQVQDNLGGYFTIKKDQLDRLPLDEIFFGYGDYFFRLLFFAQGARLSIVEIPAIYFSRERGESKSNFISMLFSYTRATLILRRKYPRRPK